MDGPTAHLGAHLLGASQKRISAVADPPPSRAVRMRKRTRKGKKAAALFLPISLVLMKD